MWSFLRIMAGALTSTAKAHIKSALVGASITVPIKDGKLVSGQASMQMRPGPRMLTPVQATGTWQGIW